MFKIYLFGFQCGLLSKDFLMGEVAHGALSEPDYEKIVGDNNVEATTTQP